MLPSLNAMGLTKIIQEFNLDCQNIQEELLVGF